MFFWQFEIIINVLVSSFRFIWIPILNTIWILSATTGAGHVAVNSRNAEDSGSTPAQCWTNVCEVVPAFIRR